jgi:phosphatidylserine/phosphatidylglycerophosphate/cardiolipin synthase-like enzyme
MTLSSPNVPTFWRRERAENVAIIIDAERYFEVAREAFLQATKRIMLVGWDFDARVRLSGGERLPGEPAAIGDFLYWVVERTPELELYLLRWDVGALKALFRGSTALTVLKWMRHPRIHTKLDGHHPTGGSHHQKIVSIDDCLAFCGGIDITGARWDTRAHRDDEPRRVGPTGKSYAPWHDATTALAGAAASALADLCRERWQRASGEALQPVKAERPCWPGNLDADFTGLDVAIARTFPEMPDAPGVHEIERLFVAQIESARRLVYVESQYFASRKIAEAIARRLDEPDGPEIVILNPVAAEGWLQPVAMDTARARLMEALRRRDRNGHLAMYHPYTADGEPIYVHAKIMIIDDRELRVGSANLNNRSMRLDSECDILVTGDSDATASTITAIRNGLLAEHLARPIEVVTATLDRTGSLIATIEQLRRDGARLRPYTVPDLSTVEAWLADNEVLDPEGPDEMFEPLTKRGIFRGRLSRPKPARVKAGPTPNPATRAR